MTPPTMPRTDFDDHLGLMARDFSGIRLIVFHGVSGSGKSTAIARLLRAHPEFRERDFSQVSGPDIGWRGPRAPAELIVVDECAVFRDLLGLALLLSRGHRVLAASHLPVRLTALLGMAWPAVLFRTDTDPSKIERYLAAIGIAFNRGTVRDFVARFGASYGWVDRILDFDGGRDFDRAYDRFTRCCRVETTRNPPPQAPSTLHGQSGRPVP